MGASGHETSAPNLRSAMTAPGPALHLHPGGGEGRMLDLRQQNSRVLDSFLRLETETRMFAASLNRSE
jgi:hypothetical protein